ncbi:MAG: hypothetical protein IPK12_19100 [Gemmatimonadetes bacterium]|nr:hypothetical protein [Gemmatimonadota bacterium]
MTSPVSLLAPLGAPAPSAPAPSEEPGAFAQLLAVALVSGLPLAGPAPAPSGVEAGEGEIPDDVAPEGTDPGSEGAPPADGTTEVATGEVLEDAGPSSPHADLELPAGTVVRQAPAGRAPRPARGLPQQELPAEAALDVAPAAERQAASADTTGESQAAETRMTEARGGDRTPPRAAPGIHAATDTAPRVVPEARAASAPSAPVTADNPVRAPAERPGAVAPDVELAEDGRMAPRASAVPLPAAVDGQGPRPQLRDTASVRAAAVPAPVPAQAPSAGGVAEAVRAVVDAMRAMSRPAGEQVAATVAALRATEAAAAQAPRPLPGGDGVEPVVPPSEADGPGEEALAQAVAPAGQGGAAAGAAPGGSAAMAAPGGPASRSGSPARGERVRDGGRRARGPEAAAVEPTVQASASQAVAAMVLTALRAAMHPAENSPDGDAPAEATQRKPLRAPVAEAVTAAPVTMPASTAAEGAVSPVALAEGIADATGSAWVTDLRVVRGRAGTAGRTPRPVGEATASAEAGQLPAKAAPEPAMPSAPPTDALRTAGAPREGRRGRMPHETDAGHAGAGLGIPRPVRANQPAPTGRVRAAVPAEPLVVTPPAVSVAPTAPSRQSPPAGHPAVAAGPKAGPEVPEARQELPLHDMEPAERRGGSETEPSPRGEQATPVPASLSPALPARGERASAMATGREARDVPYSSPPKEQAAGSADRVTLAVTDDAGRQTRIRVAVLGEQVRATIVPPDGDTAQQLERRMDDLTAALVRQGYADPKVTVQVAADTGPAWGGAAGAAATDTTAARGTDQPAGQERQGSGRREPDRQAGQEQRQSHQRGRQRDPEDRRR